jgi:hypothetical protein
MATTTKPAPSWRDTLPIHPAAELFPLMTRDELKSLGEDIRKYGLREPVVVMRQYRRRADGKFDLREYDLVLIDGRNRLDAMEDAGFTLVCNGKLDKTLGHAALGLEPLTGGGYAELDAGIDPYAFVISANIHRRHLNPEQKRSLIAAVLKANPEKPDRQIAVQVKADHKTVGSVRREQEDVGNIPHVETRTDTKGRQQPSRKPWSKERLVRTRAAALERSRKLFESTRAKSGAAPNRDDIGPTSNGELERLNARISDLQNENRRLTNENSALKAELAKAKAELDEIIAAQADDDALPLPAAGEPPAHPLDIPPFLRRASS